MESTVITSDDLAQLRELLVEMAGRWELLPIAMGVSMAEVDIIRLKYPQNPTLCLFEWLEQWVLTSGSPTFGKLLSALRGKVAPNLPLADHVEEFAKKKATAPTVLSEPAALAPTLASPGSPSPVVVEAAARTHPQTPSSTEPATVAMKPKVLPHPSSPTTVCDSTISEPVDIEPKTTFPFLPTTDLSEHKHRALLGRLLRENANIQEEFSDMVYKMINTLKQRVDLPDLVCFLTPRGALQYREGSLTNYTNVLQSAKSINEVFIGICPFYSFFGYGVIKALIKEFGSDDDKRRLAEYEEHFNEYCKRRVYECPIGTFGRTNKDEILLVAKLKDELEDFTLKAVAEFESTLCDIFDLPDDSLRFIEAKEGCIELHFAVFLFLESVIFPLSSQRRERLQGEGVMELRGGIHHYNLQEEGEATSEGGSTAEHCSGDSGVEPDEDTLVTDICEAAASGDTATVTALLDGGTAIDTRGQFDATPLMCAAGRGHTATVQELLARDAQVNLQDEDGMTALYWAALNGHTSTVEVLVAAGGDMRSLSDEDGLTPLMAAAAEGHADTVQFLIRKTRDINIQDENDWTALHCAAYYGRTATAVVLVAAGAGINIRSRKGQTPLMLAAYWGHTATVHFLVSAEADVNIQDENGRSALIQALQEREFEAAEVLINAGANLEHQEKATGWTALFFASMEGSLPLVRLLLERGADSTVKDKVKVHTGCGNQGAFVSLPPQPTHCQHVPTALHLHCTLPILQEGVTAYDVAETYGHESVMKELEKHSATVAASPQSPLAEILPLDHSPPHQPPLVLQLMFRKEQELQEEGGGTQ